MKKGKKIDDTTVTLTGTILSGNTGEGEFANTVSTADGAVSLSTNQALPEGAALEYSPVTEEQTAAMLSLLPAGTAGRSLSDVRLVNAAGAAIPLTQPAQITFHNAAADEGTPAYRVLANRLNYRSGPGTSYPIMGQLFVNTVVSVLDIQDGWARISWKKADAYVSTAYLTQVKNTTPVGMLHLITDETDEFVDIIFDGDDVSADIDSLSPFMLVYDASSSDSSAASPKTGDESNLNLYIALCMMAGAAIYFAIILVTE